MRNAGLLDTSKVQKAMSIGETIEFLNDKGVSLKHDEEPIFCFAVVYTQQEVERKKRHADDEQSVNTIVQHMNAIYSASALQLFNRDIPEASSILSQSLAFFQESAYIEGLNIKNKFVIPCLLTRTSDSYHLRCAAF